MSPVHMGSTEQYCDVSLKVHVDDDVLFLQLNSGWDQPEGESQLFHDCQPSFGLTTPISHFGFDLIRSISVNHRVWMKTLTCKACFFLNPTTAPPASKSNPLTPFFLFSPWCRSSNPTFNRGCPSRSATFFPIHDWHIINSLCDLWLPVTFPLFCGNEGGRGTTFLPAKALKSSLTVGRN